MTETQNLKKIAQQNGLIAGLVSVIVVLIFYFVNVELMFKPAISLSIGVFTIALQVLAVVKVRKLNQNYITFGKAFKTAFIVSIISTFIYVAFTFAMYNFIDPEVYETFKEISLNNAIERWESAGMSDSQIEQAIESTETYMEDYHYFTYLFMILGGAFWGAILSAIIGGIFYFISKDNKPIPVIEPEEPQS